MSSPTIRRQKRRLEVLRYLAIAASLITTGITTSVLGGCARRTNIQSGSGETARVMRETTSPPAKAQSPDEPQSANLARIEDEVVDRINEIRREHKVGALKVNAELARVARHYSRRMAREGFFSHYDPAGKAVASRVKAADLQPMYVVGENLFKNVNAPRPVDGAIRVWMNSRPHRRNILNGGFTQTGVGAWKEGNTTLITQVFARPLHPNRQSKSTDSPSPKP